MGSLNSSPPGPDGRHFTDAILRYIFLNEKYFILIRIWLKFVPNRPVNKNPALVRQWLVGGQAIIWTNADPIHLRIYAALQQSCINANGGMKPIWYKPLNKPMMI